MLAMLAMLATPRKECSTTRLQSLKVDHMLGWWEIVIHDAENIGPDGHRCLGAVDRMGSNVCGISGERRRHNHLEFVHHPRRHTERCGRNLYHARSGVARRRVGATAVRCHEFAFS
jgi:hypothetical protein